MVLHHFVRQFYVKNKIIWSITITNKKTSVSNKHVCGLHPRSLYSLLHSLPGTSVMWAGHAHMQSHAHLRLLMELWICVTCESGR